MTDIRPVPSHAFQEDAPPSPQTDTGTIVAIATPPGRGGIGVVRLSGPRAFALAAGLFRTATKAPESPAPGQAVFGRFVDASGETIDHGYLVRFRPPASFTGEETAELWAHGSPVALRLILSAAVSSGARPATPGEFTLRAFLNGRIDVTQAEAIRDLIEARTAFQAKVAHEQVRGRISAEVNRLKDRLVDLSARLEAAIEFSEEAEAERFLPEGGAPAEARALRKHIEALAGTYERGRSVREGAMVALVGSPNVGKSSLFNRLLEEERAIVTPAAGTTRDILEESLVLGGIPVTLLDTAGLHETTDEAGAEAVRRARGALSGADRVLLVLDWSRPLLEDERRLLRDTASGRTIVVLNKIDLPCGIGLDTALGLKREHEALEVSARSGEGITALRARLRDVVGSGPAVDGMDTFVTNVRHHDLLVRAAAALARAEDGSRRGIAEECLLLEYREALDRLGEITGEVGIDGIYDRIFSTFCIGK
jgi:tRNA modification GTPase